LSKNRNEFLYPIWDKMEKDLSKDFPLNELAFFSTYSPWHFHRLFRSFQKENVKDYIRRLRLEKAAYELKTTSFPILEIAMESGYTSQEAFTKAFRKALGITPKQFRERYAKHKKMPFTFSLGEEFGIRNEDFHIKKISAFTLLYRRHIGPYETMPGFPEDSNFLKPFSNWLETTKQTMESCKWIGISQDDPQITKASQIRFDFGTPVSVKTIPPAGLGLQKVPSGDRLQIRLRLPYSKLPDVYTLLLEDFFPKYSRRLANQAPFEVYLDRKNLETPITDLYFPLRE